MQLPPSNYPTADARLRFFDQLLPQVEAIPGVQAAAFTTAFRRSMMRNGASRSMDSAMAEDERRPLDRHRHDHAALLRCPRRVDRARTRVRRQRWRRRAPRTLSSARCSPTVTSPAKIPIGRRIRFMPRDDDEAEPEQPWRTIVGVVRAVPAGRRSDEAFRSPVVYLPLRQTAPRTASLMVRSALPPGSVMTAVRSRGAADRSRSAGLHDRDHRRGVRERTIDLSDLRRRCSACWRRSGCCCRRSASTA